MDLPDRSEPAGATITISGLTCNKYHVRLPHSDLATERARRRAELLAPTEKELATVDANADDDRLNRPSPTLVCLR
jgi:hypothetical protein